MFSGLETVEAHTPRRWTAVASFTLQAALVGAALVFPLFHPEGLPEAFAHRRIFVPVSQGETQGSASRSAQAPSSHAPVFPLIVNRGPSLPHSAGSTQGVQDIESPPTIGNLGVDSEVPFSVPSTNVHPLPQAPAAAPHPPVSVMMEGNLLHRITPTYPIMAKQLGVQGTVLLHAIISRSGRIEQLEVVSGHPLLRVAALDAVKNWVYRPYRLNGEPIEVETQITVNFVLQR